MTDRPSDPSGRPTRFTLPPLHDEATSRAIEAFVSGPDLDETDETVATDETFAPSRRAPEVVGHPMPDRDAFFGVAGTALVDPETGLDTATAWELLVRHESKRIARHGDPIAVVFAELDGLDGLSGLFGADVADRLIVPTAELLRRHARGSDRVARLGRARFAVLLLEADEAGARTYVERVREATDRWLEAGALKVRLAIGWASLAPGGDIASAARAAQARMFAARRLR